MSYSMMLGLALGIAAGIVLLVLTLRVKVRVKLGASFADLRDVSRSVHESVGEYMRANYSGDPAQLSEALRGFLPHLREIIRQKGNSLDDDMLRALLVASIAAHRIATRAEAATAFDEALHSDQKAA
jgi:uncharacterized iron-regulated protein